jgi:two-component system sensor histidine kinase BarA
VRHVRLIAREDFDIQSSLDPLVWEALSAFEANPNARERLTVTDDATGPTYLYVQAVRQSDLDRVRGSRTGTLDPTTRSADPLRGAMVIQMRATWASKQLLLNRVYIITAGLLAVLLAIVVFWFVTTRIILSPVRVLRDTAEKVAEGDLNIRSDINTGDEFEQLGQTFNEMLGNLKRSQDQLEALNEQLDVKLGEMAQSNVNLYEANRVKTDFLANVSHELRTPLNSIIGFAELLSENLDNSPIGQKQLRYANNILASSRSLLDLINELLDLAKIEAGRVDLHMEPMSISDACEGLANLIRPQADRREIEVALEVEPNLPMVRTDARKLQQILFNFLSNALKFTPEGGRIELGAGARENREGKATAVAVWVSDNGPGIPKEQQERIFEKFHQGDSSHTRQHGGAGLGLAISKELSRLLNGEMELDSDEGAGARFTLVLPLEVKEEGESLMP